MARTEPFEPVGGPPDALIGLSLGDYVVERFVAQGGMGMVYLAVHPVLKRRAAVKVLRPELVRDKDQEDRFLKEAQAISSIHHRGIIQIHTFGWLPDGRQYMVMEFLEGKTLEQLLHEEGPLPANRALPIIDEVLDALSAAHGVDVVHRDLKPSNVFMALQSNGTSYAKLVDFGLAKSVGGTHTAKASVIAGTPEYISPEQARGTDVTAQTDLYCLGVMMFEMLSGGLPFAGTNLIEFLRAHIEQPAPRVSSYVPVHERLDDLVASLLEKDPADRPSSAEAVRRTIAQILRETRDASTQEVSRERISRPVPSLSAPADPYAFDETRRSGSDPESAAQIKAVRERASGSGLSSTARRSSSKSNVAQAPRPSRPSQPVLVKRPSKEVPIRAGERVSGESQQTLTPVAVDADTTAKPFAPVRAQPPARKPMVWVGASLAVAALGVGGAIAAWRVTRPPPSEIVEVALPPKHVEVVAPVQQTPTPAPDPELERKLAEARQHDDAAAQEHSRRDMGNNLWKVAKGGIHKGDNYKGAEGINTALAEEVAEKRDIDRQADEARPADLKARYETAGTRSVMQREELAKKKCVPGWKTAAHKQVTQLRREKTSKLDPDAAGLEQAKEKIDEDAKDLNTLITNAGQLESCVTALQQLESWEHAR